MARRRSSIGIRKPRKIGTEELNRTKYSTMANSGQINDPRFGFHSSKLGKTDVCVFYAKFAAKMFLNLMIGDDEIEWLDDNTIRTSQDVIIKSKIMREIHKHKISAKEERYYSLDESYEKRALIIQSNDEPKPFIPGEDPSSHRRNSRKGMTLMKTIAEELGMTPREARGILRNKMEKPQQGWAWRTSKEVNKIKSILRGTRITIDFSTCKETS